MKASLLSNQNGPVYFCLFHPNVADTASTAKNKGDGAARAAGFSALCLSDNVDQIVFPCIK